MEASHKLKIKTIQPSKKRGWMVIIFSDSTIIRVKSETFAGLGLSESDPVSETKLKQLHQISELDSAADFAFKSLSHRPQTSFQLKMKLESRNFTPETVSAVLEKMSGSGAINDELYAQLYIQDKSELKKWGPSRIKHGLKQAGIAENSIENAFQSVTPVYDLEAMSRKVKLKYSPLNDLKNKSKAIRFLQYRGYSWSQIDTILNQAK